MTSKPKLSSSGVRLVRPLQNPMNKSYLCLALKRNLKLFLNCFNVRAWQSSLFTIFEFDA